jgi:hypothetical protein
MWRYLNEDTPLTELEINAYIEAWLRRYQISKFPNNTSLTEGQKFELQSTLYDHVYQNLDSLDSKTGALTQAASVLMAVFAIIFGTNNRFVSVYVLAGIFFSTVAVLLSLYVVAVRWSKTVDFENRTFDQALVDIIKRRNKRTRGYRLSRQFLYISIAALALYALQFVSKVEFTFSLKP